VEKIRALIDAIVPTPEEGKLRVDLTGALAGILSVAQKDQRPRPEDEAHASQVKLVAGAQYPLCRNHRRCCEAASNQVPDRSNPGQDTTDIKRFIRRVRESFVRKLLHHPEADRGNHDAKQKSGPMRRHLDLQVWMENPSAQLHDDGRIR
jgi:hypothetical protein